LFNFYGLTFAGITIEEFWTEKYFKNVTQLILQVVLVNPLKALLILILLIKILTVTIESLGKRTVTLNKTAHENAQRH
jgi:uncharacterized membrane protein